MKRALQRLPASFRLPANRHTWLSIRRSSISTGRWASTSYRDDSIVAPLVRQLPWTQNLIILEQSKRAEEREFYLRMAVREQWSKRELERQFRVALFERTVLSPAKVAPAVRQMYPEAQSIFKDAYT